MGRVDEHPAERINKMAGYNGYSMSNNAVAAYEDGEMPLSKWSKSALLERCGERADELSRLTVAELRRELLTKSSWHHTSNHYNRTDFYSFDADALADLTPARISEIIGLRAPRTEKPDAKTITAEIRYTTWEGQFRNYRRPKEHTEIVTYRAGDKMIGTSAGSKRLSSVTVLRVISEV